MSRNRDIKFYHEDLLEKQMSNLKCLYKYEIECSIKAFFKTLSELISEGVEMRFNNFIKVFAMKRSKYSTYSFKSNRTVNFPDFYTLKIKAERYLKDYLNRRVKFANSAPPKKVIE